MVWRVVHVDARAVLLMLAMVAPMLTVGSAWPPVADLAQVACGRPLRLHAGSGRVRR
jgi:hypothetical protein